MLPPFIIEQIRNREKKERSSEEQPRVELPLERRRHAPRPEEAEPERGVVILELL